MSDRHRRRSRKLLMREGANANTQKIGKETTKVLLEEDDRERDDYARSDGETIRVKKTVDKDQHRPSTYEGHHPGRSNEDSEDEQAFVSVIGSDELSVPAQADVLLVTGIPSEEVHVPHLRFFFRRLVEALQCLCFHYLRRPQRDVAIERLVQEKEALELDKNGENNHAGSSSSSDEDGDAPWLRVRATGRVRQEARREHDAEVLDKVKATSSSITTLRTEKCMQRQQTKRNTPSDSDKKKLHSRSKKPTTCCIVLVKNADTWEKQYDGVLWRDILEDLSLACAGKTCRITTLQKSASSSVLSNLRTCFAELRPPAVGLPEGNVGTPTASVMRQIHLCNIPAHAVQRILGSTAGIELTKTSSSSRRRTKMEDHEGEASSIVTTAPAAASSKIRSHQLFLQESSVVNAGPPPFGSSSSSSTSLLEPRQGYKYNQTFLSQSTSTLQPAHASSSSTQREQDQLSTSSHQDTNSTLFRKRRRPQLVTTLSKAQAGDAKVEKQEHSRITSDVPNIGFLDVVQRPAQESITTGFIAQPHAEIDEEYDVYNPEADPDPESLPGTDATIPHYERGDRLRTPYVLFENAHNEKLWDKGDASGLVMWTDAQYWDANEGGFDERTTDLLDAEVTGVGFDDGESSSADEEEEGGAHVDRRGFCSDEQDGDEIYYPRPSERSHKRTTDLKKSTQPGSKKKRRKDSHQVVRSAADLDFYNDAVASRTSTNTLLPGSHVLHDVIEQPGVIIGRAGIGFGASIPRAALATHLAYGGSSSSSSSRNFASRTTEKYIKSAEHVGSKNANKSSGTRTNNGIANLTSLVCDEAQQVQQSPSGSVEHRLPITIPNPDAKRVQTFVDRGLRYPITGQDKDDIISESENNEDYGAVSRADETFTGTHFDNSGAKPGTTRGSFNLNL
ncbi:unnamed protein product [Amoebophrya sp. A25]|nr:unnamed protein product [Amoebophrya sp. A25]|eukprot:GSA25T00025087001.1